MRVVDGIAQWFEQSGFRHYFGVAGGALWPLLDALIDRPQIEGIQAKHEAHAVHMADVYYRVTGRVAPILVTKGPGLLNCPGAMANAMHDSSAVMLIAGSGPTHFFGKGGFQEIYYHGFEDAVSVFRPVVKGAWLVVRPDTVIETLNHALKVATSGRPGGVLVQLPVDIQQAEVDGDVPTVNFCVSRVRPARESVEQAAKILREARRPLVVAGGGVIRSPGGPAALRALIDTAQLPVATTLTAKGAITEDHPLALGPVGRSGTGCAAQATREADVILAVGARFSDNHTGNWRKGMIYNIPEARLIHVDLDYEEIGRNYPVALAVQSDAGVFLQDLTATLQDTGERGPDRSDWLEQIGQFKDRWFEAIHAVIHASTTPIHPARLCYDVGEVLPPDGRVFIDVGDVIQYAEAYMRVRVPGAWQINAGLAQMGWATCGILGALVAERDRPAVALTGDGAFNMVSSVLATAVEQDLPAVWVILNNCEFGIERKGATAAFGRAHPWVEFRRRDTGELYNPDFARLAQAYGAQGIRVERAEEFAPALKQALAARRPTVLDVPIDRSVPTYFTPGLDRAYPNRWSRSYPAYGQWTVR